ncbi:hypothetical protein [Paenibacillus sp. S29]|uniref:hypothetical protein n=1 Tax=Paenibacillus sp. S29 TaxID=3394611 RepID=UPI0039BFA11D
MEQATKKLKAEMDKSKNKYVKVIGEFLLQHIQGNPQDADKLLDKDKTIAKSLNAMRKAAEKVKEGNMAMLSDAEGFAVVLEYFGIDGESQVVQTVSTVPSKPSVASFDVSLEDLLGGE